MHQQLLTHIETNRQDLCHTIGQAFLRPVSILTRGHSYRIEGNTLYDVANAKSQKTIVLAKLLLPATIILVPIGALLLRCSTTHKNEYLRIYFPATPNENLLVVKGVYPDKCQEALNFAHSLLEQYPNLKTVFDHKRSLTGKTYQPVNTDIARLFAIHHRILVPELEGQLKDHSALNSDPWKNSDVIAAADKCMKVAYAISVLTLTDLEPFIKMLAHDNIIRTPAEALKTQEDALFRTFFTCNDIYRWTRGGIVWLRTKKVVCTLGGPQEKIRESLSFNEEPVPRTHFAPFYWSGTKQNEWNTLFNDFCSRSRLYFDEEEMMRLDERFIKNIKMDRSPADFSRDKEQP